MTAAGPRRAVSMLAVALSTVVEWYDFTLCLYFAPTLSRVFFGQDDMALGKTLAGFAIAYLMRPFGAILFGLFGDRYGRRPTLLMSMAAMTLTMLCLALLPTYAQVGSVAGGALILMRCIMGFSVGGEYTAVVAYLFESAPLHRRGFVTSLAAAASEIGGLLAVGFCAVLARKLDVAQLDAWGWRLPFLFGGALAGVVWVARNAIMETPLFVGQPVGAPGAIRPLIYVLRNQARGVALGFAISALGSVTYYIGITYVPSFLATAGRGSEARALEFSSIAALVVIAVTPCFGWLSDLAGRKPVLLGLCLACVILPVPMFQLIAGGSTGAAMAGVAILAALGGGVSAVGATATAEQFSDAVRLTGLALGATTATALFGGAAPYVVQTLQRQTGFAGMPGVIIAAVAACVGLTLAAFLPHSRGSAARDQNNPA
ncbi:MFS transporter [Rhodoblastus sp. 17X3]|uniref:MFS transporter n=1 Tax=Rhodoblastus sp. 17X3 TaxID=3047026 RepID=UPI0024B71ED7|nr:MFS transporter [Rhodoblastus sp. 17X3]MDI9850159.1 MFS transporter [Rhodoblastus sp. 17X3]